MLVLVTPSGLRFLVCWTASGPEWEGNSVALSCCIVKVWHRNTKIAANYCHLFLNNMLYIRNALLSCIFLPLKMNKNDTMVQLITYNQCTSAQNGAEKIKKLHYNGE